MFCVLVSQAQRYDIPLNFDINQEVLLSKAANDSLLHTGVKPQNQWFISNQTFNNCFRDSGDYYYDVTVKLYQKHLLEIHQKDVHIGMDVLLDFFMGNQYSNNVDNGQVRTSTNSRGFRIVANIGNNVSFETRFYENQIFYPNYLDSIAGDRGVAFGIGRSKAFKGKGFDAGNSMGTISFKASDHINLKFGHDKLFIGHGYRSLLLSDNASNYPYLSINLQSKNKKWQYMSTYAWMQSLNRSETVVSTEALFRRKNAGIHYLSFKPSPKWEIGLFESTIFKKYDGSLGFVNPHPSFYNPLIGLNTIINGLQNENNSLLGINLSYLSDQFQVYSQVAVDDTDKIGIQIGGKWFSPFGLKKNWFLTEFNSVPSYMYTHDNEFLFQRYTHLNQELAHPLGASFNEFLIIYHFEKNRWFANTQFNFTARKRGDDRQLGENIFRATDHPSVETTEYQNINTYYWKIEGGYSFNIKSRFQIFGQVSQRFLTNAQNASHNQKDFFFVLGVRCNLNNTYFDL